MDEEESAINTFLDPPFISSRATIRRFPSRNVIPSLLELDLKERVRGQSNNSLNFTTSLGHFFFKFQDQTGCNKRPQIPPPLSSSCSLFPKLVKPLSSIILNMAHINKPMLRRKYRNPAPPPPPPPRSRTPAKMGGGGERVGE